MVHMTDWFFGAILIIIYLFICREWIWVQVYVYVSISFSEVVVENEDFNDKSLVAYVWVRACIGMHLQGARARAGASYLRSARIPCDL